jgi:hypothetical protein
VEPLSAAEARRALLAHLDACDGDAVDVLGLLTTELVANSIRHAGLGPAIGSGCKSVAAGTGSASRSSIATFGDLEATSRRGRLFVDRMADRWGITQRPDNRRIWFELRVPCARADEARAATR